MRRAVAHRMFASAVRLASKSAPLLAGSAAVGGGRAGAGVSRRAVATATAVVGGAALWLASEQGRTVSSAAAEKVVVAFGWNQYGQLGIGNEADQPQPQEIGLEGVAPRSVAAGSKSSAIVTVNGELYTFGCSKDGRLGHGFSAAGDNETMPRLVSELTGTEIKSVAVGDAHMAVSCARACGAGGFLTRARTGPRSRRSVAVLPPAGSCAHTIPILRRATRGRR